MCEAMHIQLLGSLFASNENLLGLLGIAFAQVGHNEVFIGIKAAFQCETSQASGVDFPVADADQHI